MLFHRRVFQVPKGTVEERRAGAEPTVVHDSLDISSIFGIRDEHKRQEIPGLGGNVIGEGQWGVDNIFVQQVNVVSVGVGRVVVEGEVTGQHSVEDDTATPNVHGGSDVHAVGNDKFGSSITRGPTTCLHEFIGLVFESIGETEVRDYHVPVSVKEEVFEFEVTMNDLFLVNVPDAGYELTKEFACVLLLEVAVGEDVVEEFTSRRVLEDDTDVLVGFDNVIQSDDIGVFKSLKQGASARPPEAFQWTRTKRIQSGWQHTLKTSISRSTFDMRAEVSMFPLRISFTATSSPHCIWRPSLTLPNSPSPRV